MSDLPAPSPPQSSGETAGAVPPSAPQSTENLQRGESIGRYLILNRLGAGGMGVVYAAYDPDLNRKVAIKLLRASSTNEQDATEARLGLLREAQAMARLSHPNVIAVFDVGTAFEQVFVAMEFVQGGTLTDWLSRGPRSVDEILEMFCAIGRGLSAAHEGGLIHRDFKPDNVLIGLDGRPRVTDFGLAAQSDSAAGVEELALELSGPIGGRLSSTSLRDRPSLQGPERTSRERSIPDQPSPKRDFEGSSDEAQKLVTLVGTPRYMAPEQFLGEKTDARTDLYSFCIALYEALYGTQPFAGSGLRDLAKNRLKGRLLQPPARRGVPTWVRRALVRGLSLKPEARFQTMAELLGVLSPEARRGRRRILLSLGAALAAGAIILGGVGIYRLELARQERACNDVSEELDRIWGPAAKARAKLGLFQLKPSYAEDVWSRVESNVEKYLEDWRSIRAESCYATYVSHEQSKALHGRIVRCLETKLQEVAAFSDLLCTADEEILERAVETTGEFSSLKTCTDAETLSVQTPEAPDRLARVNQLHLDIATVKVMTTLGRYAQARERAQKIVKMAQEVGYDPATTKALWQLGNIQSHSSDFSGADQSFFGAVLAGVRAGDHRETANAYAELMRLTGHRLRQFDRADRYHDQALAELFRVRGDPWERTMMEVKLLWYACLVDTQRGEYPRAEASCQHALRLHQRLTGSDRPATWISTSLADLYKREGRFDEALSLYQQSLEYLRKSPGPEHPRTGSALFSIGGLLAIKGQTDEAFKSFHHALAICKRSFGVNSPKLYDTLATMARWSYKTSKLDDALTLARQAFQVVARSPDPSTVAEGHRLVGDVLYQQEKFDEALVEHQMALDLCDLRRCDRTYPAYLVAVAEDLRELGRGKKEGLPLIEQAMRLLPATADRDLRARAQFVLAKTLFATERKRAQREHAIELAETSCRTYRELGLPFRFELAEVERWLEDNR